MAVALSAPAAVVLRRCRAARPTKAAAAPVASGSGASPSIPRHFFAAGVSAAPLTARRAALRPLRRVVRPAALLKQSKESIQWVNVLLTAFAAAAVALPLRLAGTPALSVFAGAVLAAVLASLLAEAVGDALRQRHLRVSGEKAAWLANAEKVAAAARAKAAAGLAPTQSAKTWAERNVQGAASEDDALLIRSMNEFLGVDNNDGAPMAG